MIGIGMPISHKRIPRMVLSSLAWLGALFEKRLDAAWVPLAEGQVETAPVRRACSSKAAASSALV